MQILFPSNYFNEEKPDEMYLDQESAFKKKGYQTSTINTDDINPKSKILPIPEEKTVILYRGWMLNLIEYKNLVLSIQNFNCIPFTNFEEYSLTHHLPNWYDKIKELTPKTAFFSLEDNIKQELDNLGWNRFFIKDYVKSLKTSVGSIIDSSDKIDFVLQEMEKFRGSIEGGICVRKVEEYREDTEQRFFVIKGAPYSSDPKIPIPDIVKECSKKINSPFFSVDALKTTDGKERIVEIGDGQVSDIVGWSAKRFVEIWRKIVNKSIIRTH